MELDELKQTWQALGRQLERQDAIQWQLLKDRKLDGARSSLRPLLWGQALQMLLGVGLLLLGVACWSRNAEIPALLVTGIILQAFGTVTLAMAGITMGLITSVDYSAPVMKIQKQFAALRRFYVINANVCGLPWWIMWVPVMVALSSLGGVDPQTGTPLWIPISLGIGVVGLLTTCAVMYGLHRRRIAAGRSEPIDESSAIRRGRALLDEIARFERE